MPAFATVALWALLLSPATIVAALTVWADRRLRGRLPGRTVRAVRGLWGLAALALFAAPLLAVYALRTATGQWGAPAPGLVGFRIAGWLVLSGVGLLLAGGALAAVAERWAGGG